jgi:hypothetical protein
MLNNAWALIQAFGGKANIKMIYPIHFLLKISTASVQDAKFH